MTEKIVTITMDKWNGDGTKTTGKNVSDALVNFKMNMENAFVVIDKHNFSQFCMEKVT